MTDWADEKARRMVGAEPYLSGNLKVIAQALRDAVAEKDKEIKRLRRTALDVGSSLAAALSLLKAGEEYGAMHVVPSDKMWEQMIQDYENSLSRLRDVLKEETHD